MIKKLRKKLIRISILTVAAVMVLLCAAVNTAYFLTINARLNDTLDTIVANGGRMPDFRQTPPDDLKRPEDPDRTPDPDAQPDAFRRMKRQSNEETPFSTRYFVLYYQADGTLIRSDLDRIAAVTDDETQTYLSLALQHGEGCAFTKSYKYLVAPQSDGSCIAVFLDDYKEMNTAKMLLLISSLATVACVALISVLIVLFSKKAVEPMVENDRRQKQFITDASHELKTPITVIHTCLSVLEMEVGQQKWIDKAKAQTDKLKELVNSLVTLSRMNEKANTFHPAEFDVSAALRETAESFVDFAAQNGHALDIRIEPDVQLCADEYAVRQLASLLLDNAVKYTTDGMPILFAMEKSKKGVVVRTKNECDTLDTAALDQLFDRFYRADKSRGGEKNGFGIGLSVARGICEAHRGSIRAVSPDGRTIEFIAELKSTPDGRSRHAHGA